MRRTFSGAAAGQTTVFSEWTSSGSAGKGRRSIVESVPPSIRSVKVDFLKPFEAHNINEFTSEPAGSSTKVTWAIRCESLRHKAHEHLCEHG
jgi:hypothetical protein